jgi:hypothetical protein
MFIECHASLWRALVMASFLSTLGCTVRTHPSGQVTRGAAEADVAAVYAAVISAETRPKPGAPTLVAPLTRPPLSYDCRPTTQTESDAWRSAIDSYISVRYTEASIPSTLPLPRSLYRLLPREGKSPRGCDTQKAFPFIQMSRVGFDTTRTLAVVHRVHACSCIECGDASDLFLQKQNGEWRIVQPAGVKGYGWIS